MFSVHKTLKRMQTSQQESRRSNLVDFSNLKSRKSHLVRSSAAVLSTRCHTASSPYSCLISRRTTVASIEAAASRPLHDGKSMFLWQDKTKALHIKLLCGDLEQTFKPNLELLSKWLYVRGWAAHSEGIREQSPIRTGCHRAKVSHGGPAPLLRLRTRWTKS
jgi:hypothetical protein